MFYCVCVPKLLYPFTCFHVLDIVNRVVMNKGMHVPFAFWFPPGICLGVGLLCHMVVLLLVFKGISILSSIVAVSIYIPTNTARVFPFLHTLSSIYCICFCYFKFLIGGELLYNIVLVSAIHQHEPAIGIHMTPSLKLHPISHPVILIPFVLPLF